MKLLKNLISIMSLEILYSMLEYSIGIRKPKFKVGDSVSVMSNNRRFYGIVYNNTPYNSKVQQTSYHYKTEFRYQVKCQTGNSKILVNRKSHLTEYSISNAPCLLYEKVIS